MTMYSLISYLNLIEFLTLVKIGPYWKIRTYFHLLKKGLYFPIRTYFCLRGRPVIETVRKPPLMYYNVNTVTLAWTYR